MRFFRLNMKSDYAASCLSCAEALLKTGRMDDASEWLSRADRAVRGLKLIPLSCRMDHLEGLMECSHTESLERGMGHHEAAFAAARDLPLPEAAWRIAFEIHKACGKLARPEQAGQFLATARDIIQSIVQGLPEGIRQDYVSQPEAAELLAGEVDP
jgi:hypothetical protein